MLDLGVLKLNETEQAKNYYVGVWDTEVVVTRDPRSLKGFDQKGKIKVIHDGTFFGSQEDREKWVEDMITSYLIEKGYLVKTGETVTGEPVWKLRKEDQKMYYRLRLVNYFDVWGNKKDGWEVNNLCTEWDDVWSCDLDNKTLLKILKNTGFLQKHVRTNQLIFDWIGPDCCEILIRHNEYPLGRIEIIDQKEDFN